MTQGLRHKRSGTRVLLLTMGMWPHFSFSKSKLRKCSITGQEHGMGVEVNREGEAPDGPKNYSPYPCVYFWIKESRMSLILLQTFQKGESIWFGQERAGLPKDSGRSGLMVRDEATFCVPGNPCWSTVQGRGWIPHEGAQKTGVSPGQLSPYICGETEVQSCLLGEKISGKCKKLLREPCLVHSVPLVYHVPLAC